MTRANRCTWARGSHVSFVAKKKKREKKIDPIAYAFPSIGFQTWRKTHIVIPFFVCPSTKSRTNFRVWKKQKIPFFFLVNVRVKCKAMNNFQLYSRKCQWLQRSKTFFFFKSYGWLRNDGGRLKSRWIESVGKYKQDFSDKIQVNHPFTFTFDFFFFCLHVFRIWMALNFDIFPVI